jgi:mRNA interferase MazF
VVKITRGEIWTANLPSSSRGENRAKQRPCLIISVDLFNQGAAGLVVVLAITPIERGIPFHVEIAPNDCGLKVKSFIKCEEVRSISVENLGICLGNVSLEILTAVEDKLRILMGL